MPIDYSAEVRAALRHLLPVAIAVAPFGVLYGAVATGRGLSIMEAVGFSVSANAGASQLAALELIGVGSPILAVVLSVFAINFRHVLYSASAGRHLQRFSPLQKAVAFYFLTDPSFGAVEARARDHVVTRTYFFTYALSLYAVWIGTSLAGAVSGDFIDDPKAFGIDVILPVYFLALLMAFRSRSLFYPVALASAFVSTAVYVIFGPPWHVTLGTLGGVLVAVVAPLRGPAE
ncbi:AzlC family ABC transporter permease [Mangrovicella endophytica]|uniref:AzlC family ABC transporter permease n=1 Tax=Mangrovicella endophytica TaxID=2066697 RepID=UPI000C9DE9DE|nr:AzlC family ABC transporter permease [Mangrovicella endophytica]